MLRTYWGQMLTLCSCVSFIPYVGAWAPLFRLVHLHFKLPFSLKNFICLLPFLPEGIRCIQRILHELHICHFTISIDPTPDGERACARLAQGARTVCELPKHSYVLALPEKRLDLEFFISPDLVHGGESINDSLRAFCNGDTDALAYA